MDGIPPVDRWVLVIEIFHFAPRKIKQPKEKPRRDPLQSTKPNTHNSIQFKHTNVIQTNIDHIPSNTMHSCVSAVLYDFEDNEAVIKMIIKGRSPTMRHVSRTHRVALEWLFDRINLDPQIQVIYIDSKHQLADILTNGNFTRDEWNNLLHLVNICRFRSLRCTKIFSLISSVTMANRNQEQEERVVSKSRFVMNLLSYLIATSSSAASRPIVSKSREMSGASEKPSCRMNLEASSFGAASASQV